jgi:hypothetical protein
MRRPELWIGRLCVFKGYDDADEYEDSDQWGLEPGNVVLVVDNEEHNAIKGMIMVIRLDNDEPSQIPGNVPRRVAEAIVNEWLIDNKRGE